jgi:hypothetical protein
VNLAAQLAANNQTNQAQMKLYGDMASFLAATHAAAMASTKPPPPQNQLPIIQQQSQPPFPYQDINAALAAAYKLNQQQQMQQNYTASIAKYMALAYNKPVEYIQRLLAEQVALATAAAAASSTVANGGINPNLTSFFTHQQQQQANLSESLAASLQNSQMENFMLSHQQQQSNLNTTMTNSSSKSSRFYPYLKPNRKSNNIIKSNSSSRSQSPCNQSAENLNIQPISPAAPQKRPDSALSTQLTSIDLITTNNPAATPSPREKVK